MASGNPTSLKQLLPAVLGRIAKDGKASALSPVWADVAGPQLAKNAEPCELSDGTLVVKVTGSGWAREVDAQSARLCALLSERLGRDVVKKIVCRFGP